MNVCLNIREKEDYIKYLHEENALLKLGFINIQSILSGNGDIIPIHADNYQYEHGDIIRCHAVILSILLKIVK